MDISDITVHDLWQGLAWNQEVQHLNTHVSHSCYRVYFTCGVTEICFLRNRPTLNRNKKNETLKQDGLPCSACLFGQKHCTVTSKRQMQLWQEVAVTQSGHCCGSLALHLCADSTSYSCPHKSKLIPAVRWCWCKKKKRKSFKHTCSQTQSGCYKM